VYSSPPVNPLGFHLHPGKEGGRNSLRLYALGGRVEPVARRAGFALRETGCTSRNVDSGTGCTKVVISTGSTVFESPA
jgi:hypothetical protein